MKRILVVLLVGMALLSTGCLSLQSIETHIQYQGPDKPAKMTIVYRDISSGEAKMEDVTKDFEALVKDWQGDEYLLDQAEEGFFVKDRAVFIEDGKIIARAQGIVKNPDKLHWIWAHNGELIMLVEEEEDFELVESNGEIFRTAKNTLIVWPEDAPELYFKQQLKHLGESHEKNRAPMIRMLEEYLETAKK